MLPRTQCTNRHHPLSVGMAGLSALLSLRGGCSGCFIIHFGFVSQCGSLHRSAFIIVCDVALKPFCLCSLAAEEIDSCEMPPMGCWPQHSYSLMPG